MDKFGTAAEERTHAVEEIVEKQKEAPGYRRMTPNKEQRKMGKKMLRYLFLYQIWSKAYFKAYQDDAPASNFA